MTWISNERFRRCFCIIFLDIYIRNDHYVSLFWIEDVGSNKSRTRVKLIAIVTSAAGVIIVCLSLCLILTRKRKEELILGKKGRLKIIYKQSKLVTASLTYVSQLQLQGNLVEIISSRIQSCHFSASLQLCMQQTIFQTVTSLVRVDLDLFTRLDTTIYLHIFMQNINLSCKLTEQTSFYCISHFLTNRACWKMDSKLLWNACQTPRLKESMSWRMKWFWLPNFSTVTWWRL